MKMRKILILFIFLAIAVSCYSQSEIVETKPIEELEEIRIVDVIPARNNKVPPENYLFVDEDEHKATYVTEIGLAERYFTQVRAPNQRGYLIKGDYLIRCTKIEINKEFNRKSLIISLINVVPDNNRFCLEHLAILHNFWYGNEQGHVDVQFETNFRFDCYSDENCLSAKIFNYFLENWKTIGKLTPIDKLVF